MRRKERTTRFLSTTTGSSGRSNVAEETRNVDIVNGLGEFRSDVELADVEASVEDEGSVWVQERGGEEENAHSLKVLQNLDLRTRPLVVLAYRRRKDDNLAGAVERVLGLEGVDGSDDVGDSWEGVLLEEVAGEVGASSSFDDDGVGVFLLCWRELGQREVKMRNERKRTCCSALNPRKRHPSNKLFLLSSFIHFFGSIEPACCAFSGGNSFSFGHAKLQSFSRNE